MLHDFYLSRQPGTISDIVRLHYYAMKYFVKSRITLQRVPRFS